MRLAVLFGVVGLAHAVPNGLGMTPPLAWSSWNYFAFGINETIALEIGDALIETGLHKLGYEYVNIDAGSFEGTRDPTTGKIVAVASKYPHGIRWLADQLHAKGLKLGVYTDISLHTCGGSGSMGHYQIDAETYAYDWEVDYLKVDYCGPTSGSTNITTGRVSYQPGPQYDAWMALGLALNATGRPIYYSICPHRPVAASDGLPPEWTGGLAYAPPPEWSAAQRKQLANSILVEYTNTFDAWYIPPGQHGHGGIITDIDSMVQLTELEYSGPGSWNDADMLQLCTYGKGNTIHSATGMTLSEYRAHYSVWAVLASPLILSADLRTIKQEHPDCLELMLNAEIVGVNQDPLGLPGRFISQKTNRSSYGSGLDLAPCAAAPTLPGAAWVAEADGSIRVDNGATTLCLDAYNCNVADGTPVGLYACHPNGTAECGYKNQQWRQGDGTITNANSQTCLTVNGSSTELRHCVGGDPTQALTLSGGLLKVGTTGQCLFPQQVAGPADITSQIFARSLQNGATAVVLLNRDETAAELSVSWAELGLPGGTSMAVRDVINGKDLPHATDSWSGTVGKHDVAFIRLSPV